jgi:Uma2 family endonuclease
VVKGSGDEYRNAHPTTAELVIEVAITSADIDREKAQLYAAADVREYWLVLANERIVEVNRSPLSAGFAHKAEFTCDDVLSPQFNPGLQSLELRKLFTS